MAVAIKIEETKKEKIDRFVASLMLQENIKITAQEAIGLMVDYAIENEKDIVKKIKQLPPLEDDPAWKILNNPKHWGVNDSSTRIDESVYGC
jgi:hypothetical protein